MLPRAGRVIAVTGCLAVLTVAAAAQPAPTLPSNGAKVLTVTPVFAWSEIPNATSYLLTVRQRLATGSGAVVLNRQLDRNTFVCSQGLCAYKLSPGERLSSNPFPPANPFLDPPRNPSFLGYQWWVTDSFGGIGPSVNFEIPPLGVWDDGNGVNNGDFKYYACALQSPIPAGARQDPYCLEPVNPDPAHPNLSCRWDQPSAAQTGHCYQGGFWNLYDDLFYLRGDEYDIPPMILKAIAFGESASGMGPRKVPQVVAGGAVAVAGGWFEPRFSYLYEPYRDWLDRAIGRTGCAGACTAYSAALGHAPAGTASEPYPFGFKFPAGLSDTTIAGFTWIYGYPFANQNQASSGFQLIDRLPNQSNVPVCGTAAAMAFDAATNKYFVVDAAQAHLVSCTQQTHQTSGGTRIDSDYRTEGSYGLSQIFYSTSFQAVRRSNGGTAAAPERLYDVDLNVRTEAEVLGLLKRCAAMANGSAYAGAGQDFNAWDSTVWRYNGATSYSSGVRNRYNAIVAAMGLGGTVALALNPIPSSWLSRWSPLYSGQPACDYRFLAPAPALPANGTTFSGTSSVVLRWYPALSPVGVPVTYTLEYGIGSQPPAEGSWLRIVFGDPNQASFPLATASPGTYWWRVRATVSDGGPQDPTEVVGATSSFVVGAPVAGLLRNADMETETTAQYGSIDQWGPNGGWAFHANYPRPGNGTLGSRFGFYSAGTQETVGQTLTTQFAANTTYQFAAYVHPGLDNLGTVPFQIGYVQTDGTVAIRNTGLVHLDGATSWQRVVGVTYRTDATGPEIGRPVVVRFGSGNDGGVSDIWFDNLELTAQP